MKLACACAGSGLGLVPIVVGPACEVVIIAASAWLVHTRREAALPMDRCDFFSATCRRRRKTSR
jgi:hypothetical protein